MDFKKILPHFISVAAILAVACLFFAPNAFSGKELAQSDNTKARGMQAEIMKYKDSEGVAPLWTNAAFSGMPSFQIWAPTPGNYAQPLSNVLFLGQGIGSLWSQIFCAMFCMYLFLIALRMDWRVALFGSLAYGVTTYNVDILEAGHTTKMMALAFAPGMLAGAIHAFRGRYLLGGGMLALFTAMQLVVNHVQITYYTFIIIGFLWLVSLVYAFRHKSFVSWGKAVGICLLAMTIGFMSNTSKLWPTYEYSKETIRGKSELKASSSKGDGLDKDYLFGWSYGIGESLTVLVPHYAGGGAGESAEGTELYKQLYKLFSQQDPKNAKQTAKQTAKQQAAGLLYSGSQPFVGTAIYFGAIVLFLAFLAAFLVPGEEKVWLLTGALFTLSLAWGKHFFMNDLWYSVLPMFNKFRAVSMALGISQLCVAALAAMGLQKMMDADVSIEKKKRSLYYAAGLSAVLLLIAMGGGGNEGPNDAMVAQNQQIFNALKSTRASLVRADVFRSFALIALAFGLLWFYLKGKLKSYVTVLAITLFALADHWTVAARTLRPEKYTDKKEATAAPAPQPYDAQISADKDPHYRVLDLARGGLTGNATTSYFHKSLSGYHAAKLQRYQEVITKYFEGENAGASIPKISGMFNAKYIVTQQGQVVPNQEALGNAWFVDSYTEVEDGDAELDALGKLNLGTQAVVQKSYATTLNGLQIQADSTANIKLTSYNPDRMEYSYTAKTDQLAMFSEVYYPPSKGWQVTVNGAAVPEGFFKANYTLRGLRLPASDKGTVVMEFKPTSYYTGAKISAVASTLALLLFLAGLFFFFKNGSFADPSKLDEILLEKEKTQPSSARNEPKESAKKRKK